MILPNTSIDYAFEVAEKFREKICKTPILYENNEVYFSVSIGVAEFDSKIRDFNQLFRLADKRLYASKARGRNCPTKI